MSKLCFTMFTFKGTFDKYIWVWKRGFQMMQILGLLGIYFDAVVVFVTNSSLYIQISSGHTVISLWVLEYWNT